MSTPDFYQGRLGYWHFHCDGYTSSPYHSYDAAKMAYAAWVSAGRPGRCLCCANESETPL